MNRLEKTIANLEADSNRTDTEDQLLMMLYEAREVLGMDVSDEEAENAVIEARKELLRRILYRQSFGDEEPVWSTWMDKNVDEVRRAFAKMGLDVKEYIPQKGEFVFEADLCINDRQLTMRVCLEEDAGVCQIDAVYPFWADDKFMIPLSLKLKQENSTRRFGALKNDENNRRISWQYVFQITHEVYKDDFRNAFMAVAMSADSCYDAVKRYACGCFNKAEREYLICCAQQLIIELDQ